MLSKKIKINVMNGICLNCGKKTKFINLKKGYNKYCSRICSNTNGISFETRIKMSKSAKNRMEKMTDIEKHNFYKNRNYILTTKGREILKTTCKNNFKNHIKTDKQKESSRKNLLKSIHSENSFKKISEKLKNRKFSDKHKSNLSKSTKKQWDNMTQEQRDNKNNKMRKNSYTPETREKIVQSFYKNGTIKTSKGQFFLYTLLKEIYPQTEINYPNILQNRLIDIYIPELKMCIEYDGMYFHKGKESLDIIRAKELQKMGYKTLNFRMYKDCFDKNFYLDSINNLINRNHQYKWIKNGQTAKINEPIF